MKNNIIMLCIFMLASGTAYSQSLLNPAGQSIEGAAKNQLENSAEQKLLQSAPSGVQQGLQEIEAGKAKLQQLQQLQGTPSAAPTSTGLTGGIENAVQGQVKQNAEEKALNLLK